MPKSRKRTQSNKNKRKILETRRELRDICAQIKDQDQLNMLLLKMDDPFKRKQFFDCMSPYLGFLAVFPSKLSISA